MKISTTTLNSNYALQSNFANLAGEIAESFAFNRSLGQIYGFLYLSMSPASLTDIVQALEMSKGSVSINLRILEDWGAVKQVWVKGSRRDYYEANRDLKEIIISRIKEGFSKRVEKMEHAIQNLRGQFYAVEQSVLPDSKFMRERLAELENLVRNAHKVISLLPKLEKFL